MSPSRFPQTSDSDREFDRFDAQETSVLSDADASLSTNGENASRFDSAQTLALDERPSNLDQTLALDAPSNPLDQNESETDIGEIAEQFLEEYRTGGKPSVEDYAARYPEIAADILELFPTLVVLEKGSERDSLPNYSESVGVAGLEAKGLERLKNYRVMREIGRGGMGVVYEAWDETLERLVALKVMKIFPGEEEQTIKRFQREAKMAAQLHHTNIVPVFSSDRVDDRFYYAMQLIDGKSLEKILREKQREESRSSLFLGGKRDRRRMKTVRFDTTKSFSGERDSDLGARPGEDRRALDSRRFDQTTLVEGVVERLQNEVELESGVSVPHEFDRFEPAQIPEPVEDENIRTPLVDALRAMGEKALATCDGWAQDRKKQRELKEREKELEKSDGSKLALEPVPIESDEYYRRVAKIGIQAARALDYAHRREVLHRDIKPSNLILDVENDLVWITDFGLAKQQNDDDLTRQGQLVGTLRYLAPEALEGVFSTSTDLYSLGLTLYELLALSPAFGETTYSKLLAQVAAATPSKPRKLNPKIPVDLETIVLKSIERAPEKRYVSGGALADDLQRWLDDRPIQARRIGLIEIAWRWSRRHKSLATLSGLLVALAFAFLFLMSVSYVRVQSESTRAQRNVDLAMGAFEELFEALSPDQNVKFDFIDDRSYYNAIDSGLEISEKDERAIDLMLRFYDAFAENNQNNPELLRKAARAYSREGVLSELLGRNNSEAYDKAFQCERECLKKTVSDRAREEIALEMGDIVAAMLEDGVSDVPDLIEKSKEAIRELSYEPKNPPLKKDARQDMIAKIRYYRASYFIDKLRRDAQGIGFFDRAAQIAPEPFLRTKIDEDMEAAHLRFHCIEADENADVNMLALASRFHSTFALWKIAGNNVERAEEEIESGEKFVERLRERVPNESITRSSECLLEFTKSTILDGEARLFPEKAEELEERFQISKRRVLDLLDELIATNPRAPQYAIYSVVVYFHYAKREAIAGNLDASEELLERSDKRMVAFLTTFPDYEDFQYFPPLLAGRVELALKRGRLDDAEKFLEALRRTTASLEQKSDGSETKKTVKKEVVKMFVEQTKRLESLLEEAKNGTDASNSSDSPRDDLENGTSQPSSAPSLPGLHRRPS